MIFVPHFRCLSFYLIRNEINEASFSVRVRRKMRNINFSPGNLTDLTHPSQVNGKICLCPMVIPSGLKYWFMKLFIWTYRLKQQMWNFKILSNETFHFPLSRVPHSYHSPFLTLELPRVVAFSDRPGVTFYHVSQETKRCHNIWHNSGLFKLFQTGLPRFKLPPPFVAFYHLLWVNGPEWYEINW